MDERFVEALLKEKSPWNYYRLYEKNKNKNWKPKYVKVYG